MAEPPEVQIANRSDRLRETLLPEAGGGPAPRQRWGMALTVLGVVYGDLGTSAIYAPRAIFAGGGLSVPASPANVMGVFSLVLWTLFVVVSVKYMVVVLSADNQGEGGTFALLGLLRPWRHLDRRGRHVLVLVALVGASMLYTAMMITPAISILSAVEGLAVASPVLSDGVLPFTLAILVALFGVQRYGTARIGAAFGPIMALWFVVIAVLGAWQIAQTPQILQAVDPRHAWDFFRAQRWSGFVVLFAVFLVTTGAEALYADLGHFGRDPIRRLWFFFVLPALLFNYLGQGALLLRHPAAVDQPFFGLVHSWLLPALVVLATLATMIASQATISGAFSMTRQAIRLGMMPRLRVVQTSTATPGQVYVPMINWLLMAAAIALVILFGSSERLARTYGISVSSAMLVTTVLMFFVARERGRHVLPLVLPWLVLFLGIDLAFLGSNLLQVPHGGWFPLAVGAIFFAVMSTWRRGGELLAEQGDRDSRSMEAFLADLARLQIVRVPGTAVFLTLRRERLPPALSHHIERNRALQQQVVLLTVLSEDVPRTSADQRLELVGMSDGFYRVVLRYGYMQQPNIPSELAHCRQLGLRMDLHDATYYVGRVLPISGHGRDKGMAGWRDRLLAVLTRNSSDLTTGYQIPSDQVVELGLRVRI